VKKRLLAIVLLCAATIVPRSEAALLAQSTQGQLISQAIEDENAGRHLKALDGWRAVITAGGVLPGVLGLERVYTMMGDEVELLPILDSLISRFPDETQIRSAQLRTLVAIGRDAEATAAFRAWRDLRPTDVAPYRDYARILLYANRAATADSVLQEATDALGSSRALLLEAAQLQAALGRWREAASAWRETMRDQPYYESAAVFSLGPAPDSTRDDVRRELAASAAPLGASQALAMLEIGWGAPRAGWQLLQGMPPSDTVVSVWRAFAEEAERAQAWAAARDALVAIHRATRTPAIAERGANVAMRANDPATALTLARAAARGGDPEKREALLGIELEALGRLGRAAEAERTLAAAAPALGPTGTRGFARTIAWAWVQSGDVAKARAAIADAPLDADDAVTGWLALFDGDLAAARPALRQGDVAARQSVPALALLSRTKVERSPTVGGAFLALARGDSSAAASGFAAAASEITDATSLLLVMAARVESARGADARALPLWKRVAEEFTDSPEAPEARLEWARTLARRNDQDGARTQYEELIIQYPTSALVPQARREMEALRTPRAPRAERQL
jgi:tetratricopeptide (TPR) repeat protein